MSRKEDQSSAGSSADADRYLLMRDGWFHYNRRVPEHVKSVDSRRFSRKSLKTRHRDVARIRRDELEQQDDLLWSSLAAGDDPKSARQRYETAQKLARSLGIVYKSAQDIAAASPIEEVVERALLAAGRPPAVAEAALGGAAVPDVPVSEAIEIYIDRIAVQDYAGYSEKQVTSWKKIKRRAARNFVSVVGDPPILSISRTQAQEFWEWWNERVQVGGRRPNTARRDFSNMRKLFGEYARWTNIRITNPFDGLTFKETRRDLVSRKPFSVDWITNRFLTGAPFATLNPQARHIFLTAIETGCRPSEICNLRSDDILLDGDYPRLAIRFHRDRVLKTDPSERDIPLVGIALAAMRRNPQGFPKYLDREDSFSAAMLKHLRRHALLETPQHVVYSLRHSFEDRMKAADLHYDFRCAIMGHKNDRPDYGDGGSEKWKRDQLEKIVLHFEDSVL